MLRLPEIRRWLGMDPPRGLVRCLHGLGEWSGGSMQQLEDGLDDVFGVSFADTEDLTLPAEVFPFLQVGAGGIRYAYVVWAPELEPADHPVVQVTEAGALTPYAPDTPSAFRRLLGEKFEWDEEYDERMAFDLYRAMALPEEEVRLQSLKPHVPVGWHHQSTRDGVGVLAPRAAFALGVSSDPGQSVAEHTERVTRLLHDGKPASALVLLKDACHVGRSQPGIVTALGGLMADVYVTLGRAALGLAARRRTALLH